jgi:hypothetical protein
VPERVPLFNCFERKDMKEDEIEVLKRLKAAGLNSQQIKELDEGVHRSDWGKGQSGGPEKPNVKSIPITKAPSAAVERRLKFQAAQNASRGSASGKGGNPFKRNSAQKAKEKDFQATQNSSRGGSSGKGNNIGFTRSEKETAFRAAAATKNPSVGRGEASGKGGISFPKSNKEAAFRRLQRASRNQK